MPYNSAAWSSEQWPEDYFCRVAGDELVRVRPELFDYLGDTKANQRMTLSEYFNCADLWYKDTFRIYTSICTRHSSF